MLKFIEESDYLLVDSFVEIEPGVVEWKYSGEDGARHSGVLIPSSTRVIEVQTGTESVQVGNTNPQYDLEGNVVVASTPIYEDRPTYGPEVINLWNKLVELDAGSTIEVTWVNEFEFYSNLLVSDKLSAKVTLDSLAGSIRAAYVSSGQLIQEEYRHAKLQADLWDGTGSVPATIQSWADASGMTPLEAQADVIATAASWELVLETIRQVRLEAKAAVDAAESIDSVRGIVSTYSQSLNSLRPS